MNKNILIFICCILCSNFCIAQNTVIVRQEINVSPYYVAGGSQESTSPLMSGDEQGSGCGIFTGYTALFGWLGFTFNFYYQSTEAQAGEILKRYQYSTVISGDYSSTGFLTGVDLNIPITTMPFKSYAHFSLLSGAFMAHLPQQEFSYSTGETANYPDAKNAGYAFQGTAGLKADVSDWISLSLNVTGLSEHADLVRNSNGSLDIIEYYNWNFNYNILQLMTIFKF